MINQDGVGLGRSKPEFIQSLMTALQEDIVSFTDLQQLVHDTLGSSNDAASLRDALEVILNAGIQVGQALNEGGNHVKFVAWGGGVDERIARVERILNETLEHERGFAVWFFLKAKVDEYAVTV